MTTKSTDELEKTLGSTHMDEAAAFLRDNSDAMITSDRPFGDYMHEMIKEKGLQQTDVFIDADIPDRYGYKLLSEQKHTKQRDIILRLCYAAHLTLDETQKALKLYNMPQLYAKNPRDAVIMIAFNTRPGSIIEVNIYLKKHGMDILRSTGVQE